MRGNQDDIFAISEADRYFDRNKSAMTPLDETSDLPLRLMGLFHLRPRNVLEVGAANGFRLGNIAERFGARTVAVEPSGKAIADGQIRFPRVEFVQAMASSIPLVEKFDCVIVHFVLHWIDRAKLFRSIAEIDRLLDDGGFLLLGDFQPANQLVVPYHHCKDDSVATWKQNYAQFFISSGLYHLVGCLTSDHATDELSPHATEEGRIGVSLLRKQLGTHYILANWPRP